LIYFCILSKKVDQTIHYEFATDEGLNKSFTTLALAGYKDGVLKIWGNAKSRIDDHTIAETFRTVGINGSPEMITTIWEIGRDKISKQDLLYILKHIVSDPKRKQNTQAILDLPVNKLEKEDFRKVFVTQLMRGNFDSAIHFLEKVGDETYADQIDSKDIISKAINNAIAISIEPKKELVLEQLIKGAGLNKSLDSLDQLANYYFSHAAPSKNNYKRIVEAMIKLDTDFTLMALTINGLFPPPFTEDIHVYRGTHYDISDEEIAKLFEYGTRSFSNGVTQKFLGYYVRTSWNPIEGVKWANGGTHVSADPLQAAIYGVNCPKLNNTIAACTKLDSNERKMLFEIILRKGTPKICGMYKVEREFSPSYIKSEELIAIYELESYSHTGSPQVRIIRVHKNPNIQITPSFEQGQVIKAINETTDKYNSLCGTNSDEYGNTEQLYRNPQDFAKRYSKKKYAIDLEKLISSSY
ncbi:MAG: hypothetical protein ACHP6I_04035, partial [Rickettsiales bacterium]